MVEQQLIQKRKDMSNIDRRVAEIKELILNIRNDPKAMKEIEALTADNY